MFEDLFGYNTEKILSELREIRYRLDIITRRLNKMAIDLTGLTAEVTRNTDVEGSAVTLIQGIAAQIAAAVAAIPSADPATQQAVTDLTNQLKSSADALAAAVTANTPAAPVV